MSEILPNADEIARIHAKASASPLIWLDRFRQNYCIFYGILWKYNIFTQGIGGRAFTLSEHLAERGDNL